MEKVCEPDEASADSRGPRKRAGSIAQPADRTHGEIRYRQSASGKNLPEGDITRAIMH